MLVGAADTLMISCAGGAAVSGVWLVDMINGVFIFVFNALATGGAVMVSQYLGSVDREKSDTVASRLVMISILIGIGFTVIALAPGRPILGGLFASVDEDVMAACVTCLMIAAFS